MKTLIYNHSRGPAAGFVLLLVLVLTAVALLLFAGLAKWTWSASMVNERHNTYNASLAAAEGASEQGMAYVTQDFFNQGFNPARLSAYQSRIPTNAWAANYEFSDNAGEVGKTWVSSSVLTATTNLDPRFVGLYGMSYSCTVRSRAKPIHSPYPAAAAVEQNFQMVSIPLFQFAIFYALDLEINPGPIMKVTGKVHSNANLYTAPRTSLEYCDTVTAVGDIFNDRHPDDPQYGSAKVPPAYDGQTNVHVPALTMPIISNTVPAAVRAILEVPPATEAASSIMGRSRYYNLTDLVIVVTDSGVTVKQGHWGSFAQVKPDVASNGTYSFVATTNSFYDAREQKWTVVTDVDIGALNQWMTNAGSGLNQYALLTLGHALNSIYVDDQRSVTGKLTVVRVRNGAQLPPNGLTLATSRPLYVQGHFNAPAAHLGTLDTSGTVPASLVGDAVTFLSSNWSDSTSTNAMTSRNALDTTVNAALLAGIVPTTNAGGVKQYSGGVENFPRFVENWSGRTFTYSGSMVVMFPSQFATNFWVSPGSTVYNAPNRNWAFDNNFKDYTHLPPATPQVRQIMRGQWTTVAAQ